MICIVFFLTVPSSKSTVVASLQEIEELLFFGGGQIGHGHFDFFAVVDVVGRCSLHVGVLKFVAASFAAGAAAVEQVLDVLPSIAGRRPLGPAFVPANVLIAGVAGVVGGRG